MPEVSKKVVTDQTQQGIQLKGKLRTLYYQFEPSARDRSYKTTPEVVTAEHKISTSESQI
jgi:hypothetical protein